MQTERASQKDPTTRLLAALGICKKAGGLVLGTPMVCDALASNKKPLLVLVASDNSENTDKRLRDKCSFYGVERLEVGIDGETLAHAVGKSAKLSALAITDVNLVRLVKGALSASR